MFNGTADITLPQFRLLSRRAQLLFVMLWGTYLAQRWGDIGTRKLYYLADGCRGFFAEVGIDEAQECFVVLRSFYNSSPLADYADQVQLPGEQC